ncbi:carboxylesterase 4A-like [Anoplophora glabripennis]|nr:carboxylesterase 4A-like [Anoplophora glabripennis]
MVSRMVKLWANFARTGNPTPRTDPLLQNITWPSVNSRKDMKYLDIDSTLTIKSNYREEHMKFWDYIYEKHGGKSYITY